jgi:hypothetical protein
MQTMAYSDYGGYAYRNGVRIEDRSDCTITPEGDTFGTPGSYPGFAMIEAGVELAEVKERIQWPSGHAVIGDGPIYVVLYKQSTTQLFRGPTEIDLLNAAIDPEVSEYTYDGKVRRYINVDHYKSTREPLVAEADGYRLTVYYEISDNHYQYAKLEQPDGTVWHGWSGYGVGAGLEDAGYGYSTHDCDDRLWELFTKPEDAA